MKIHVCVVENFDEVETTVDEVFSNSDAAARWAEAQIVELGFDADDVESSSVDPDRYTEYVLPGYTVSVTVRELRA